MWPKNKTEFILIPQWQIIFSLWFHFYINYGNVKLDWLDPKCRKCILSLVFYRFLAVRKKVGQTHEIHFAQNHNKNIQIIKHLFTFQLVLTPS